MQLKGLIIAACCFAASAQASAVTPTINGQNYPAKWFHMSLNNTANSTELIESSLSERTDVTVCVHSLKAASNCAGIGTFLIALVKIISSSVYGLSKENYKDISYIYYASGSNCDTTAKKDTIAGALKHYFEKIDKIEICDTECLRMDHGGTWDGWLKIGPTASFDKDAYCGPELSFSSCTSGGEGDI
ncbi:uncharacterized protein N7483_010360 [Penicillium malachiteum]|uniref:uncharacterized protein n=1 Tax=Penicillium malachiteum TaxID=1324776 RepID=UPI002547C98D|nr:uncharacterized protein N7483_010360 [Penicillium malachiteum]KAJ5713179.1 hypothetical protein N7483_010360 [Penicillium malachiteum]